MQLVKANRFWNYKTYDLTKMRGDDFLDKLGDLLDEAGRNGWELAYMCEDYMVLKQLFEQK
ncbi:MAG: hypothetical protein BWY66_00759 [bacterium ADurb.Bin374]|nr:MAG: hypothetical protein BWY66_00759 [bacterium ADurb.Bin374]